MMRPVILLLINKFNYQCSDQMKNFIEAVSIWDWCAWPISFQLAFFGLVWQLYSIKKKNKQELSRQKTGDMVEYNSLNPDSGLLRLS